MHNDEFESVDDAVKNVYGIDYKKYTDSILLRIDGAKHILTCQH